jgi:hypothetical protein
MRSVVRRFFLATAAIASLSTLASAQVTVRRPTMARGDDEEKTKVTFSVSVGKQKFDETTQARCTHAPMASIYNTLAKMWSVEYPSERNKSLHLTVWQPMRGDTTPQITFYAGGDGKSQEITTVKASGGATKGTGTVAITKHGAGGRFDINGTTADGAKVSGSIDCEKFAAPMAVGGN